jgi:hypothetical protein
LNRGILCAIGLGLLACRATPSGGAFGHTLARGDELADVPVDAMVVRIDARTVHSWGLLEVPDGSRLQAAYAGVDAIARAELLKLVRVRVADLMVSVDSTDPARRDAYERTLEAVAGSLRHGGELQHGWARVQRGSGIVLRVWARLTVARAEIEAALRAAHMEADIALPKGEGARQDMERTTP